MGKIILFGIIGLLAAGLGFLMVKDIHPPQEKVAKEIQVPSPKQTE